MFIKHGVPELWVSKYLNLRYNNDNKVLYRYRLKIITKDLTLEHEPHVTGLCGICNFYPRGVSQDLVNGKFLLEAQLLGTSLSLARCETVINISYSHYDQRYCNFLFLSANILCKLQVWGFLKQLSWRVWVLLKYNKELRGMVQRLLF